MRSSPIQISFSMCRRPSTTRRRSVGVAVQVRGASVRACRAQYRDSDHRMQTVQPAACAAGPRRGSRGVAGRDATAHGSPVSLFRRAAVQVTLCRAPCEVHTPEPAASPRAAAGPHCTAPHDLYSCRSLGGEQKTCSFEPTAEPSRPAIGSTCDAGPGTAGRVSRTTPSGTDAGSRDRSGRSAPDRTILVRKPHYNSSSFVDALDDAIAQAEAAQRAARRTIARCEALLALLSLRGAAPTPTLPSLAAPHPSIPPSGAGRNPSDECPFAGAAPVTCSAVRL